MNYLLHYSPGFLQRARDRQDIHLLILFFDLSEQVTIYNDPH